MNKLFERFQSIEKPGLFQVKDRAEYLTSKVPGLNSSLIKAAQETLAHFYEEVIAPTEKESDALDFGNCHDKVILHQSTDDFCVVPADAPKYPSVTQWNAKKPSPETVAAIEWWTEFENANKGKIQINQDRKAILEKCLDVACEHPFIHKVISNAEIEKCIVVNDHETGLSLKCLPDIHWVDNGRIYVANLKSARSVKKRAIQNQIADYGYDISLIHEGEVLSRHYGMPIGQYYLFAQESSGPCSIRSFRLDTETIAGAQYMWRTCLNRISVAIRENNFPAYSTAIQDIGRPTYAKFEETSLEESA